MRDLVITLIVFGAIPFILLRPHIGLLIWSWLGYMSPHRLSYGFAYSFPFVMLISALTIVVLLFSKERKKLPINSVTILWLIFIFWMCISTIFAFYPVDAQHELIRTIKIQVMVLVTMMLFQEKEKIIQLVCVIVFSLGFYGVKGGVFVAATGGSYRVWGPPGSFVEGNNELALALIMILPFMFFLFKIANNKYIKYFLIFCMFFTTASILGSYSRGAFLALSMITLFLWLKSDKKLLVMMPIVVVIGLASVFLPQEWFNRMNTIETYEEDSSAMGRVNAWHFAFNLAIDNPLIGGGYGTFTKELFRNYAPVPEDHHDAHSIYFEVLAEQGFIGLLLFLSLGFFAWRLASKTIKACKGKEELTWAYWLASMSQVSLIGYASGGAFLGLAYYDLPYHIISIIVVLHAVVMKEVSNRETGETEVEREGSRKT